MNTYRRSASIYPTLTLLILIVWGLTGCGTSPGAIIETVPNEIGAVDTPVEVVDVGEINSTEYGFDTTPRNETLIYTNEVYGFEFAYPGTWTLTEEDNGVVLKKGTNRLGINFRWADEEVKPYNGRTGMGAGDLINSDKVSFLDKFIPVLVLYFRRFNFQVQLCGLKKR